MEASAVPRVAPAGVAAFASPGLLRVLSDDRLVALIRDGNRNAFEAVYDRHYRAILSFCRHMLGCADEAEDAVQHTFLAAYNDLVSSRKPIRLRAWLFTIARNRCLSILRARRERTALEFEEQATDGLAVQVQRRQDLRDLVVDINHLPDDQRAALVLAEMGALTHDEIGSVIGVPKDKVKALIFQARESLLADRAAREADCREIREQLSTMRGAALRRTTLRRHLRECQGCREYRHELESQRRRIAAILPVVPTFALRDAILGVTAGGGIAGASVAGGGMLGASSVLKGLAGKALIAALLTAVGTTGTILVVHDLRLAPAAPVRHSLQTASSGVLGPAGVRLATGSSSIAAPGGAGRSAGGALTGAGGLGGVTGTTGANALLHALTGQLSNLLSPVWPHEKLGHAHGALPHRGTQPPAAGPVVAAPAPASSSPAGTSSRPTLPTASGSAGGGSGASGHSTGGSARGGPGPSGLTGQSGSSGSSAGSGSASGASGQVSPGASSGVPSGSSGAITGSTGSGVASGPGPSGGPGPATTPAPTSGPGPGPGSGPGPGGH